MCNGAAPATVVEALSARKARSSWHSAVVSVETSLVDACGPALALQCLAILHSIQDLSTSSAHDLLEKLQFTVQVDQLLTSQVPETGIHKGRGMVCHSILSTLSDRKYELDSCL